MSLRPELREQVLAAARRSPTVSRADRVRGDTFALALGALCALAVFAKIGGVNAAQRSAVGLCAPAVGWATLAVIVSVTSASRGGSMLGRTSRALLLAAAVTAPGMYAWACGCTAALEGFGDPASARANLGCFLATLGLAAAPFAAFAWVRRGSDPVHPRLLGAALGAAAGAWGGVLIDLHCPVNHWMHVGLAHVAPALVFAALGALVGKRAFGVR